MTYLGLVHPYGGTPRSHWARVFLPGTDSTRSELKLAFGLSLALIVLLAAGMATQNWFYRIGVGCAICVVYVPLCLRSLRYLRHST
jgi:hypothetical protein